MGQAAADLERLRPAGAPAAGLAGDYPASVRAWGDLLAVLDPPGERHAERSPRARSTAARRSGLGREAQARVRVAGYLHALDPAWISDGMLPWSVGRSCAACTAACRRPESEIIARELDRGPRAA